MTDLSKNKEWIEIQEKLKDVKPPVPSLFQRIRLFLFGGKALPVHVHVFKYGPSYKEKWDEWNSDGTKAKEFCRTFQDGKCECGIIRKLEIKPYQDAAEEKKL